MNHWISFIDLEHRLRLLRIVFGCKSIRQMIGLASLSGGGNGYRAQALVNLQPKWHGEWGRGDVGSGDVGSGDVGSGDVGTWGRGDVGTWGRGDVGTWGRGDVGTWGRGDVGTWGRGEWGRSRD